MARQKKDREVSIVHFSFFDLLFGAFGAFVFLMIMQVISTLNLVDVDIQKLVDDTVQEKVALSKELEKYKETDQKLKSLQQQFDQLMDMRKILVQKSEQLAEKNSELVAELKSLRKEIQTLDALKDEAKKKETLRKELVQKIEKLDQEKQQLDQKNAMLETSMASLKQEIDSLKAFKAKIAKQGDLHKVLEKENQALKNDKNRLAQEKTRLESQLAAARKKISDLNQFKQNVAQKGDVLKALEEEKRKLEKSLDQTKNKLAALKTMPLKIKTRSFPTTITEEKVNIALAAEGGFPPYTWKIDGKLPSGLALNQITGNISGIVKTAGKYNFKVKVTDARGLNAETKNTISFNVIKKPKEQEKKVSPWFVVMTLLSSLLLLYILWGKYKAHKAYKEMISKGYKPSWVRG